MSDAAVHIVDDDANVREGLQALLESAGFDTACYESAESFVTSANPPNGCAVIDLRMPGTGGLELQQMLGNYPGDLGIVFISGHSNVSAAVRAMRSGAVDFLTKPVDPEALLDRVGEIMARYAERRDERAELSTIRERRQRLTAREREVMTAVVAGGSNKEIARELNISYRTVELHRAQVMDKMAADSIADLVRQNVRLEASERSSLPA